VEILAFPKCHQIPIPHNETNPLLDNIKSKPSSFNVPKKAETLALPTQYQESDHHTPDPEHDHQQEFFIS
jgi:hypothetical protein